MLVSSTVHAAYWYLRMWNFQEQLVLLSLLLLLNSCQLPGLLQHKDPVVEHVSPSYRSMQGALSLITKSISTLLALRFPCI